MIETPAISCKRGEFFALLAKVLTDAATTLPEINTVTAVPDCQDEAILDFYRWGVLSGKDEYGTLEGSASLSRAAAAAMLARLLDPAQRLTLELKTLDLWGIVGAEAGTVISPSAIRTSRGAVCPTIVSLCSYYNQSHLGAMSLR
jgi:hypothetical protein